MIIEPIAHSKPWITEADKNFVLLNQNIETERKELLSNNFKRLLLEYTGAKYGILTESGTEAITVGLVALKVGAGDEVILPTYVCVEVLNSVLSLGAIPVLCDVNQVGVLELSSVVKQVTLRTKAIIAVHIFGRYCNIDELNSLGIPILEDACQAFGCFKNSRMLGNEGTLGIYSFHPTKTLTADGGGMITTQDFNLFNRIKDFSILKKNRVPKYKQFRSINAALGIAQISRFHDFIERRNFIYSRYLQCLPNNFVSQSGIPDNQLLFRFTFQFDKGFDTARLFFLKNGVHVRRGVDNLLHRIISLPDSKFPNAIRLYRENVSVPFYPALTNHQINYISNLLKDVVHEN